jgi:DNA-binding transcriptional LysR family regulator
VAEVVRRYKEFNLTQLRVFCEFLRQKSFADAARELGMSHSAVWQQVRALERRFGVTLLQRLGRTWRPTEDGDALLDLIASVLQSVDSLDDAFRQLRGDLPRDLRVIATPGAASGELAGPVAEIKRRYPTTRVQIVLGASLDQTVEELLAGQADLALLTASMLGPQRKRSLIVVPIQERPVGVIVPPRHPLARTQRLELADLAAFPLILPAASFAWRLRCDEAFRTAGLWDRICVAVEVSLFQAIAELVRRGVGVGLCPFVRAWQPGLGLRLLPAGHLFPPDELVLVRRRGKPRPQVALLEELLLKPVG